MKRVMLASCLAFGLVVGLNAAPTLQTLTVNDNGKGERQVLGIFGNYQNINVKEAEAGATTITFSVYNNHRRAQDRWGLYRYVWGGRPPRGCGGLALRRHLSWAKPIGQRVAKPVHLGWPPGARLWWRV